MYDYLNDPNLTPQEREAYIEEAQGSLSREERIDAVMKESSQVIAKSPTQYFDFSQDADDDKIYGIDVSHHQQDIDWDKVFAAGAQFGYVKATQGATVVDARFQENIHAAILSGIPSGAYHFLSSLTPADRQADNFITAYATWHESCLLPPVIDMEWDKKSADEPDRWESKSPEEIVSMAQTLLERIESELGVKPVIYTNKSWWEARIGSVGEVLSKYPLWMSRYGLFNELNPPIMDGFDWLIWQFTEHGKIDGISGTVDVNWWNQDYIG